MVRKPGKRASDQDQKIYREQKKNNTLSTRAVALLTEQRQLLDDKGAGKRQLLVSLDGGYCNKTVFRAPLDRITLLARCRKDARLCFAAPAGQNRQYGKDPFTPEQVRQDGQYRWKRARIRYARKKRWIPYKAAIYWRVLILL